MPRDEAPKPPSQPIPEAITADVEAGTISSDAVEWGRTFIKVLDLSYGVVASRLPTNSTFADFQRAMMIAVENTFHESGQESAESVRLSMERIGRLYNQEINLEWTSEQNARRLSLIDKQIQQTITVEEVLELERLTARMRVFCDREELIPLEGARLLHQRLLGLDDSQGISR